MVQKSDNVSRWGKLLEDLKKEFNNREKELLTLQELDRRLVDRSLDRDSIYVFIVESIRKLCGAEAAQVLIRNKDNLRIVASRPEEAIDKTLAIKNCATGFCVEDKISFNSGNIWEDDRIKNRYADILSATMKKKIYSELAVPMMLRNEVVGVLNAESPRPGAFDEHHRAVLSAFASQCAVAFTQIKLVDELELFQEVFTAISKDDADIRVPVIIHSTLRNLDQYIGEVNHYQILFVEQNEMIIAFSSLVQDEGAKVSINKSVSGRAVRTKKTQIVDDVTKDNDFRRVLGADTKSEMAVPIKIAGNIVGVINFESDKLSFFDGFSSVIVEQFSQQIQWILTLLQFKHESDRKRRHGKAMEIMQAIGSQTSNLIHTLKNELIPARIRCEELKDEFLDIYNSNPNFKKKLKIIHNCVEKALSIPMEMKKLLHEVVEVRIEESIKNIVENFQKDFKNMKVDVRIGSDISIIRCRSFSGVIGNLLRNASEATDGHGLVRITINSFKFRDLGEEFVELIVEDNGPGLPKDDPNKVFEWDYTTKRDKVAKGLGFGLAWSRALVEVEGGRITAENNEYGGARFKVRYPVNL